MICDRYDSFLHTPRPDASLGCYFVRRFLRCAFFVKEHWDHGFDFHRLRNPPVDRTISVRRGLGLEVVSSDRPCPVSRSAVHNLSQAAFYRSGVDLLGVPVLSTLQMVRLVG